MQSKCIFSDYAIKNLLDSRGFLELQNHLLSGVSLKSKSILPPEADS